MKIYRGIEELIGNTPLLELVNIEKERTLFAKVLVKLERFNPAGSSKDRAALYMIKDAEEKELISAGGTLIEPTSGNTGIGMSAVGISKGYKVILTMPDTMSKERISLLKAYGAQVVLTDGTLGMKGTIDKAKEIKENIPNSFIPSQFENQANPLIHQQTTAKEIFDDTDGKVDIVVACIGSAGTISGIGKGLKQLNSKIQIVGVEPQSSPLITKGVAGAHKIQGIGANFIPKNYDASVVDSVLTVSDEDAFKYAKMMAKKQGILVGISSGAALAVAIRLASLQENQGKNIVVILADNGDRYLSTDLF